MNQAIQNGVGHGGIADDFMPLIHRELTGDDGGSLTLPVIEDFQELALEFAGDVGDPQVVHDEQRGPGQPLEQRDHAPIGPSDFQFPE